jgi:hypothetical protein
MPIRLDERRLRHIFRDAPGHLTDTPANRQLLLALVTDDLNRIGNDRFGNAWYARTMGDGSQLWAVVRQERLINGGRNSEPRVFDAETGLARGQ